LLKIVYHTQEHRSIALTAPKKCIRDDAWLGEAYYFWEDLEDADQWGNTSKRKTLEYEVYKSEVNYKNVLDTVFNETHYQFWLGQIEKVALKFIRSTSMKPSLKELNDYFKERGSWSTVTGIRFQDLPTNPNRLLIRPIQYRYKKIPFAYRKRIQIAVYSDYIICSFACLKIEACL